MGLRQAKEELEVTWASAQGAPDMVALLLLQGPSPAQAEPGCLTSCLHLLSTYLHAEPSSGAQTFNNFTQAVQSQSYSHVFY